MPVTAGITHYGDQNERHTKDRTDSPAVGAATIEVSYQRPQDCGCADVNDDPDKKALDMRATWPENPLVAVDLCLVHQPLPRRSRSWTMFKDAAFAEAGFALVLPTLQSP
jgi:hypothetical protein